MRKGKLEAVVSVARRRQFRILLGLALFYLLFVTYEYPFLLRRIAAHKSREEAPNASLRDTGYTRSNSPARPKKSNHRSSSQILSTPYSSTERKRQRALMVSGLIFQNVSGEGSLSELHKCARGAWDAGVKLLRELESGLLGASVIEENRTEESCPQSIAMSETEFRGRIMVLPCGLMLESQIMLVGRLYPAHVEYGPKISPLRDPGQAVMVSQFMMELQGLKTVDGEKPPKILHFNPRLKGDWSDKPVIEQNTCYRLQWGSGLRLRDGSQALMKKLGFVLEDATGLSLKGDLDMKFLFATSLPTMHPSLSPLRQLEMSTKWQAPLLPNGPVDLFIGILSAGNHFAERMAIRKSWMQSVVNSPSVVARFFVALHGRKEVNVELKKEAEFFGDIITVPYMDSYDLAVLKTVAICEYGVRAVSSKYVMKCDDDTFVRVDSVMEDLKRVPDNKSFYMGNMNFYHKPLRYGKWEVKYEEWPYANGPGYIVSSDIAKFVVSKFETHKLRLFKMEDVSMGMWVEKFNSTRSVEYLHNIKFCQFGCIDDYYTAHYQSPRQMTCMWDMLWAGKPRCCNMR